MEEVSNAQAPVSAEDLDKELDTYMMSAEPPADAAAAAAAPAP